MRTGPPVLVVTALALLLLVPPALTLTRAPPPPADPAARAVVDCKAADVAAERRCYENLLRGRIGAAGAGPAMALLEHLAARDPDVRRDGHM